MPVVNTAPELQVCARGWRHASWQGRYYPEDLPSEWLLAYYGNDFRAVVVPAEVMAVVTVDECAQWRCAVDGGFRFYAEYDPCRMARASFEAQCAALGPSLGGVILLADVTDGEWLAGLAPVVLGAGVTATFAGSGRRDQYWRPERKDAPAWLPGGVALAGFADDQPRGPRDLRAVVERCYRHAQASRALLLVFEGEPDVAAMRSAQVIGHLVGNAVAPA